MPISRTNKYLQSDAPDTGALLDAYFRKARIRQAGLARALNRNINTIDDYRKRGSIQTSILWEISTILKHNFFADLAARLPKEFTTDAPDLDKEALLEELKTVKAERDLLMRLMGGKIAAS